MIISVKDSNKYLYHYTSAGKAIDYILKSRTLRLSPYTGTNDPKERKGWLFDFGTNEGRDLGRYSRDEYSSWLSGEFKSKTLVTCLTRDTGPLSGNHVVDIFKRGYCKPRMWAQYADDHKGVCLVFLRECLNEKVNKQVGRRYPLLSGAVQYVDRGVARPFEDQSYLINVDVLEAEGKEAYFARHLQTHYQRLFFEKMTDWKDECEWRWVAFSGSAEPIDVKFGDALVGVVYGEDTSPEDRQKILELNSGKGIQHEGLKWKNCSPWYDWKW
ncbi:DUF2971 domain-containing protein [Pseudomonas sp. GD04058]|uniref:DUF2971 domain-containing protein n=1 Tax=Pseudomonas sp. GD04058 TaxID=2975429 RepID=UPI00244B1723|nr:DUF2971 domain-containing protein [Pseudomonas sp. GD04058]MDG9882801.1 DUF2971 domain-containing protein [Pseudomonas sp. GD04058]